MSSPLECYALIGDCETAALVSLDGSIDWLCWPRFDSAACFAALLGGPEHGRWLVRPAVPTLRVERRYRDRTLVLETDFETEHGAVTVIDFMPVRGTASDLLRIVKGRRGRVPMRCELALRFDYGSAAPWVSHTNEGAVRAVAGPDMVVLRSTVPLAIDGPDIGAEFEIGAGDVVTFALTYAPSHLPLPGPLDAADALRETERFWCEWASRCTYRGPWREPVERSLITLKALTYAPTGGLVAAPTTSLPEKLGGSRNWDYRFCWLRDATLTLLALMDAGYTEEARAWRDWLLRAAASGADGLRIMYGLAGERRLPEWEVRWLPGYENSRPVRVGNGAAEQRQLDVYGEVMDALHQARCGGLVEDHTGWALQKALVDQLESIWEEPDEGIWEVRSGQQHFTYSKAMAWVALDRTLRTAEHFGLRGPLDRWRALRDRIHDDVCTRGYDARRGAFVQAYGSKALDASVLRLPLVGFLPADDPRILGTVRAIERELVRDGFVLRYDTHHVADGLPAGEGAFVPCTLWLADNYVLQGRRDQARALFEQVLAIRNDVGLLAEEFDPRARRQLGNFPQAFSHLAVVETALNLARGDKPVEQRAGDPGR